MVAKWKSTRKWRNCFFGLSRKCGRSLGEIWLRKSKIDIGSDKHPSQSLGWRLLSCRISFEDSIRWWLSNQNYSRKSSGKFKEDTLLQSINTPKEPISLIANAFLLNVLELEQMFCQKIRLWEGNLKYQVMFKIYGTDVFLIMVSSEISLGLCFRETWWFTKTDEIACEVLEEMMKNSLSLQRFSNKCRTTLLGLKERKENNLVVGSQARIFYADAEGRMKIAEKFNQTIKNGEIGPSFWVESSRCFGNRFTFRETSNIYDGNRFTADMAIHNVIGDSFI